MMTSLFSGDRAARPSGAQNGRRRVPGTPFQVAVLVVVSVATLAFAGSAMAGILAQTDFGTTEGSNVSPFSSEYKADSPWPEDGGDYWVATSGGGHSWSSPMGDWGGLDHTNPGTGCFMVVDGAQDSSLAILSYTADTVAGCQYTLNGWVQIVQAWDGPDVNLSFRVNGAEDGTFPFDGTPFDNIEWIWREFTFTYTAVASGPTVFALHDNTTSLAMNDFGLDDLVLSSAPIPEPAALVVWSVLAGLGASASVSRAVFRALVRRPRSASS